MDPLTSLVGILVLGVAAQWVAWRVGAPSILLLLAVGLLAGPGFGILNPDKLLGSLLLPVVSLSVAVVLFEGGLSLKIKELRAVGGVLLGLSTVGVLISWGIGAVAAHYLLKLQWELAAVLGAILVVTGPTVIGPLLRHLRLGGQLGALLKWEGILIDPVGAVLAVLVFTAVRGGGLRQAAGPVLHDFLMTCVVGVGLGLMGAAALIVLLGRYWIPDSLQAPAVLATVFGLFGLSHLAPGDGGLIAVTVMGIVLANQRSVSIRHLIEFKENLTVLLIACLFLVLSARLERHDLANLDWGALAYLGVLVFVARPLAALAATMRSTLSWRERLFLCAMAPRGIVAAAVTSVFAIELAGAGFGDASRLPPIVFAMIVGTVLLYGLSAAPLARALGLARPNPQGVLLVGAHAWSRAIARALEAEGCPAMLVDSDWSQVALARQAGLKTFFGSILSEHTLEEIPVGELGRLMAVTPNDEANSLACLRFIHVFGRREVYQLPFTAPAEGRREAVSLDQRGRMLFDPRMTLPTLCEEFGNDPNLSATRLTEEFDYTSFRRLHGNGKLPLFLLKPSGEVAPFVAGETADPRPGHTIISATRAGEPRAGDSHRGEAAPMNSESIGNDAPEAATCR